MTELDARRLSRVRWISQVRISGGPRRSGDLRKWQAKWTTCAIYTRCVFGVRFRICMSSIMRRRSGLMDNSFARRTGPHGAGAIVSRLSCQTRERWRAVATNELAEIEETQFKSRNYREAV